MKVSMGAVRRLCLADLNNDGWLDLVVSPGGKNRTIIMWGGPGGFDSDRQLVLPTSQKAGTPTAFDLTGNGYLDLIIGGGKATMDSPHDSFVHIFWNDGDGFKPERQNAIALRLNDWAGGC